MHKLRSIVEAGVVVANPSVVKNKLRAIFQRQPERSPRQVKYNDLDKYLNKHALFIDDPDGDIIIVADDDDQLHEYAKGKKGEILKVKELLKRLDPKTFTDDTIPQIYVL